MKSYSVDQCFITLLLCAGGQFVCNNLTFIRGHGELASDGKKYELLVLIYLNDVSARVFIPEIQVKDIIRYTRDIKTNIAEWDQDELHSFVEKIQEIDNPGEYILVGGQFKKLS